VPPFSSQLTGSGDKMFDWVQAFTLLLIALVMTTAWTAIARRRTSHETLNRWFRVFLRIALGTTMLSYGFQKAVPLQMPQQLVRLVEPYGDFSMMGVLWTSIASSPGYETFVGLAEVAAGTLLLMPPFARIGALLCLMDSIAVWMLNMTYDVPVKLFSFHLVLMSLFLLAPIALPLRDLFVRHIPSRIPPEPTPGKSDRARRNLVIAQVVLTMYFLGVNAVGARRGWTMYGGGSPRSALYGIWDVREMTIDGVVHPPLLMDGARYRRAIFDAPQGVTFQRMNDRFQRFSAKIDTAKQTLLLTSSDSAQTKSTLAYRRIDLAHLALDGTLSGHAVHLELDYRNPNTFQQRSRPFSLVQERPFNR
jgi:hypothetical protein